MSSRPIRVTIEYETFENIFEIQMTFHRIMTFSFQPFDRLEGMQIRCLLLLLNDGIEMVLVYFEQQLLTLFEFKMSIRSLNLALFRTCILTYVSLAPVRPSENWASISNISYCAGHIHFLC